MGSPIQDLELFVVVARRLSFTAAARELGLTRSAVSKRIARLEARLGVALLHRTTRSMALTQAGERLADGAVGPLRQLTQLTDDVLVQGAEVRGTVRLAAPLAFGLREVAPAVHAFAVASPEVVVEVSYTDAWVDLGKAGVDLAIRGGVLADSALLARRLRPIRIRLVASADYLAHHPAPRDPAQLVAHRWVAPNRDALTLVHSDGTQAVVHPRVRLVADNADARAEAARMGLGIAVLPDFVALHGLQTLLRDWSVAGDERRSFFLLRPRGPSSRAASALAEHLVVSLSAESHRNTVTSGSSSS